MEKILRNLKERLAKAVSFYWLTRQNQANKQEATGQADQGFRSAVTGGAQMDEFIALLTEIVVDVGIDERHIYHSKYLELPGFFLPTKEWDLLVVKDG